jgi:hypothetical protein
MLILSLIVALGSGSVFASLAPDLDSQFGKVSARCAASDGKPRVWIFKQWHANAALDTHDRAKGKDLPQAANQAAIFRQLDRWVSAGKIGTVVAEGCAGELTRESQTRFNGWNAHELESESGKSGYADEIVSSVPLKLEARYGGRVRTLCGDTDALIRENLLAFSDARGIVGFLTRLEQHKNDPVRAKTYLDGVIELYKLPADTSLQQSVVRLNTELRKAVARIHAAIDKRNESAMRAILDSGAQQIAVVYGGMHAAGLKALLEKRGAACEVVEPAGYQNDEGALLEQLDAWIAKR